MLPDELNPTQRPARLTFNFKIPHTIKLKLILLQYTRPKQQRKMEGLQSW
jgi:hypothetical protein